MHWVRKQTRHETREVSIGICWGLPRCNHAGAGQFGMCSDSRDVNGVTLNWGDTQQTVLCRVLNQNVENDTERQDSTFWQQEVGRNTAAWMPSDDKVLDNGPNSNTVNLSRKKRHRTMRSSTTQRRRGLVEKAWRRSAPSLTQGNGVVCAAHHWCSHLSSVVKRLPGIYVTEKGRGHTEVYFRGEARGWGHLENRWKNR